MKTSTWKTLTACAAALLVAHGGNAFGARVHGVNDDQTVGLWHMEQSEEGTYTRSAAAGSGQGPGLEGDNAPSPIDATHWLAYGGITTFAANAFPDIVTDPLGQRGDVLEFDQVGFDPPDEARIAPHVSDSQPGPYGGIWTNSWQGDTSDFIELQFYFYNPSAGSSDGTNEIIIGNPSRWEVRTATADQSVNGTPQVAWTLWYEDDSAAILNWNYEGSDPENEWYGQWHHVRVVANTDIQTLWVDGIRGDTNDNSSGIEDTTEGLIDLGNVKGRQFTGYIDELQIWNARVPEPTSLVLLGLGCFAMGLRRRS